MEDETESYLFFNNRPDLFDKCLDTKSIKRGDLEYPWHSGSARHIFYLKDRKYMFVIPVSGYTSAAKQNCAIIIRNERVINNASHYENKLATVENFMSQDLDDNLMKYFLFNLEILNKIFVR